MLSLPEVEYLFIYTQLFGVFPQPEDVKVGRICMILPQFMCARGLIVRRYSIGSLEHLFSGGYGLLTAKGGFRVLMFV